MRSVSWCERGVGRKGRGPVYEGTSDLHHLLGLMLCCSYFKRIGFETYGKCFESPVRGPIYNSFRQADEGFRIVYKIVSVRCLHLLMVCSPECHHSRVSVSKFCVFQGEMSCEFLHMTTTFKKGLRCGFRYGMVGVCHGFCSLHSSLPGRIRAL